MKLFVQIPCYNEEKTLSLVVNSIPRQIEGVDSVEILVIDDGSSDRTVSVAQDLGVDHILRHRTNKGLARSFADGLIYALSHGADIIVNTDGDNQYPQSEISRLIEPILNGSADIVVADRQTEKIEEFSFVKKVLQKLGSATVRFISQTDVPDAPSGFRAYSREAAMSMNILSDFSYVIETIIQARKKGFKIASIPVKTNPKTRESRLFNNLFEHVKRSSATLLRMYAVYEPFKAFFFLGLPFISVGIVLGLRFIYLFFIIKSLGHVQSLVLMSVFIFIGFQIWILGVLADLIGANRRLIEQVISFLRKKED